MVKSDTLLCICNNVTAGELAECIKQNGFTTLQEILDSECCNVGNKCELCQDEGFDNDGVNIPLILQMVKEKRL